ncbi:ABC transporter permease [Celeribacter baekdonensis]|uniref:ABC transporter permease n=1 Tax=Celeribacter baekdonensis TaxID=875171 RepID=UPI001C2FBDC9
MKPCAQREREPVTTPIQHSTLRRSSAAIGALIIREMSSNYGKSPGGYIWAVLEPVAGITLMTLMFSFIFRQPALGTHFALFYASGMLPFTMYRDLSSKIGKSLAFSEKLLSYPAVTFMDAILARLILNLLTQILIVIVIIGGIILLENVRVTIDFKWVFLSFFAITVISCALGVINAVLFAKFPIWEQLWGILNRPMFLLSTIFYLFESAPEPFQSLLWFNPLVHVVGLMRRGLYSTYDATFVSLPYIFGPALVLLAFGLLMLRQHQNRD